MSETDARFILLFQSRDQKGIVAGITDFVFRRGGNIISAEQHSTGTEGGSFFLRMEFCCDPGETAASLSAAFAPAVARFAPAWRFFDSRGRMRMGIMASSPDHCLFELLYLWRSGELEADIPFVISNHEEHRALVSGFGVPFVFIPSSAADRKEKEILAAAAGSDFLVLARYMLTLTPEFLVSYRNDIINIHHGFLPSFKGARPYHQAHAKGVKVIGATAHFVTENLDEGPIICQKVEAASHRDTVESLIRKGKNLEKHALSSAVRDYLAHRIIRFDNKTIVFSSD